MKRGANRLANRSHDVFHSVVPNQDGYLLVWRRCNILVPWGANSTLWAQDLDASLKPRGAARALCHGEDPRLFLHEGTPWLLSFNMEPHTEGPVAFLLRLADGHRVELAMPAGAFGGKNWGPFSWQGAIHFIHGLDPLAVLRADLASGQLTWVVQAEPERTAAVRWHGTDSGFGSKRCGSAGVVTAGGQLVGAGHRTQVEGGEVHAHETFLYRLDLVTWSLSVHEVDDPAPDAIRDPTSLWHQDGVWHLARTLAPCLWERAPNTTSEVARLVGDTSAWLGGAPAQNHL